MKKLFAIIGPLALSASLMTMASPASAAGIPPDWSIWKRDGTWTMFHVSDKRMRQVSICQPKTWFCGGLKVMFFKGPISGNTAKLRDPLSGVSAKTEFKTSGNALSVRYYSDSGSWSKWYNFKRTSQKKDELYKYYGELSWKF